MPQLDRDWLVTPDSWNNALDSIGNNTAVLFPLTAPTSALTQGAASQPQSLGMFQPNDDWTLKAVRGEVIVGWDPTSGTSFQGAIDMRIEVMDSESDGTPVVPVSYDLQSYVDANRSFVWHHTVVSRKLGGWLDPASVDSSKHNVPIHAKAARRVLSNQIVVLIIQLTALQGAANTLEVTTRLRTLAEKRS